MQHVQLQYYSEQNFHWHLNGFLVTFNTTFEECHSELCGVLVFLGMALSFIELISSSGKSTKREAAIKKICPSL